MTKKRIIKTITKVNEEKYILFEYYEDDIRKAKQESQITIPYKKEKELIVYEQGFKSFLQSLGFNVDGIESCLK